MSSDPFFPEPQRKNLWQRIKQRFMLDGGGDWETVVLAAADAWTCPSGVYEVYVGLQAQGNILLSGYPLATVLGSIGAMWYPCVGTLTTALDGSMTGTRTTSGTRTTAAHNITGEIGTPGSADTALTEAAAAQTGTLSETGTYNIGLTGVMGSDLIIVACSEGWRLTTLEVLTQDSGLAWAVRFRRVG